MTDHDHDHDHDLERDLRDSIERSEAVARSSLVLNPVENFPFAADRTIASGLLEGSYNSDKLRSTDQKRQAHHLFAGRDTVAGGCRRVYRAFADGLGAADSTLRLLSGLNAHQVLLMSALAVGDTVVVLPERAGGHMSGLAELTRLGLVAHEMVVDDEAMAVDIEATLDLCDAVRPAMVLVDRSEGLVVEDFSELTKVGATSVYDASQYLTNILFGDHPNPFDDGFDLVVSSVHKNFPGPQKALLATAATDDRWEQILRGVSTFVSNMHVDKTFAAGLTLCRRSWLAAYSATILECSTLLERELAAAGVPVVARPADRTPTHHVWIREPSQDVAYTTFEAFESSGFLTNMRRLPYSLGHGVRLGVQAAVRMGMVADDVPELAGLLAEIRRRGAQRSLIEESGAFIARMWERFEP